MVVVVAIILQPGLHLLDMDLQLLEEVAAMGLPVGVAIVAVVLPMVQGGGPQGLLRLMSRVAQQHLEEGHMLAGGAMEVTMRKVRRL